MSEVVKTPGRINVEGSSDGMQTISYETVYNIVGLSLIESYPIRPKTGPSLFSDEDECVFLLNTCWIQVRSARAFLKLGNKDRAKASFAELLKLMEELKAAIAVMNNSLS